jgi:hypothetical protein
MVPSIFCLDNGAHCKGNTFAPSVCPNHLIGFGSNDLPGFQSISLLASFGRFRNTANVKLLLSSLNGAGGYFRLNTVPDRGESYVNLKLRFTLDSKADGQSWPL